MLNHHLVKQKKVLTILFSLQCYYHVIMLWEKEPENHYINTNKQHLKGSELMNLYHLV
jgi:hypothetical protein